MSELSAKSLEELKALQAEVTKQLRQQREAAKRAHRLPVRLGETKDGEQALLVAPVGRRGAPTRITREVLEVLYSEDWAEVAASFARGEELDPSLFADEDAPEEA